MSLPTPRLDERSGTRLLVEQASKVILEKCPGWTDLSPHDPGIILLESFAWLTEQLIYRLNRVPDKVYIEFLRLMGVTLEPPSAAVATLRFSVRTAPVAAIQVPRGTRVATGRTSADGETPVFVTARAAVIEPGTTSAEVVAYHCEQVDGELVGLGTGQPGLSMSLRRPPVIARTGDDLDLVVGVEEPEPLETGIPAREFEGRVYRIWRQVDSFAEAGPADRVFIADRTTGTLQFAPAIRSRYSDGTFAAETTALAAVPGAGLQVRAWYRRGGGPAGNVGRGLLTVLKDPIPGVDVTNPGPATGGSEAETLANALIRGPWEFRSQDRAVTAEDFERLALETSHAVVRARAFTQAEVWRHAVPGTVEVALVPGLSDPAAVAGAGLAERLVALQRNEICDEVQAALDQRRPLGTSCSVRWARYKTVRVRAKVFVYPAEDPQKVKQRILDRLYRTISPLPGSDRPDGWGFGAPLRTSHVYDVIFGEAGVSCLDDPIELRVDDVPEKDVCCLAADPGQERTFYAGSGATLYRSMNDGESWEPVLRGDPGETFAVVRGHPQRPGWVAAATGPVQGGATATRSHVYLSYDCGETWPDRLEIAAVNDAAWAVQDAHPTLFLATSEGLYQVKPAPGGTDPLVPVQVVVDPTQQNLGFYAVSAAPDRNKGLSVMVAAMKTQGVFLSRESGKSKTFRNIGLAGKDVRSLEVQLIEPRVFFWAALAASGDAGEGCVRWELPISTAGDPPEGWVQFKTGWKGGSCLGIAFAGNQVFAGSYDGGVLQLEPSDHAATWTASALSCGLPERAAERLFHPVFAIAAGGLDHPIVVAGGAQGAFRTRPYDPDEKPSFALMFSRSSCTDFTDMVSLPPTWLFCSGEHEIEVENEDA